MNGLAECSPAVATDDATRVRVRTMGPDHIAEVVGVQVISLDDAPRGYHEFDAGVPKKFVMDPHKLFSAA